VGYGFDWIEGKFAAAAIVNHRRTVYRVGTGAPPAMQEGKDETRFTHRALVTFRGR
jgi:hypothetical protein